MITENHNQTQLGEKSVFTLRDLVELIAGSDLAASRKVELRSAIRTADRIIAHGALDHPADLKAVLAKLARVSPAMAGLSSASLNNLRSRTRAAFKLVEPEIVTVQHIELNSTWEEFRQRLDKKQQTTMSRFMRFCTFHGVAPENVNDSHLGQYRGFLERAIGPTERVDAILRATIRTWNTACGSPAQPTTRLLKVPPPRRTSYWIKKSCWPPSLAADVNAFIASLSAPASLKQGKAPKLKPSTIAQYEGALVTCISALVAGGDDLATMTSLRQVVTASRVEVAIEHLIERAEGRVTSRMETIAARCRQAAIWCGTTDEEIAEFSDLVDRVSSAAGTTRGMTPKNRAMIDRLDDQRFRDLFLTLPLKLMQDAQRMKNVRNAASCARTAVAIEILIQCSFRRANLASLQLGVNIKKVGLGADAVWKIEFAPEDVKNGQPLRFTLPKVSAELLEHYLANWRPYFCTKQNSWLFPDSNGGPTNARSLASDICRKSRHELGVPITPHQFRHMSATVYVGDDPSRIAAVSEHLGHTSIDTTRHYYLGSQQKSASRIYQRQLGLDRERALERTGRKSSRRRVKPKLKYEDKL